MIPLLVADTAQLDRENALGGVTNVDDRHIVGEPLGGPVRHRVWARTPLS